jgi:hypothetical protein
MDGYSQGCKRVINPKCVFTCKARHGRARTRGASTKRRRTRIGPSPRLLRWRSLRNHRTVTCLRRCVRSRLTRAGHPALRVLAARWMSSLRSMSKIPPFRYPPGSQEEATCLRPWCEAWRGARSLAARWEKYSRARGQILLVYGRPVGSDLRSSFVVLCDLNPRSCLALETLNPQLFTQNPKL